jgi:AraC family transcriptional regulator, transcriptional activator of pobA
MKRKKIPIHADELQKNGVSVESINIDLSKADLLKAHRDDHYIFLLQQKANLQVIVDFKTFTLKKSCLLCIKPGQVHYYLPQKNAGYILEVSPNIIEKDFRNYLDKISTPLIAVKDGQKLITLVKWIEKTVHSAELSLFEVKELQYYTNAFVAAVCGLFSNITEKNTHPQSRLSQITAAFRELLKEHYHSKKRPADYAKLLNISTPYLNEILIKATGFSTSYWIQQEVFMEAKRLLHHTELTAKEIAFELGYEDAAYFARLFKSVNGLTPLNFRKAYRDLSN